MTKFGECVYCGANLSKITILELCELCMELPFETLINKGQAAEPLDQKVVPNLTKI